MPRSEEGLGKRQRISHACDTCRKRKSKCDGAQPVCTICLNHDRVCTYDTGGRKRGLQSGYVRAIEAVLGLTFEHIPLSEAKLRSLLRSADIGPSFLTPSVEDDAANFWHQSRLHADIQKLLVNVENGNQEDLGPLSPDLTPQEISSRSGTDASANLFGDSNADASLVSATLAQRSHYQCLPDNTSELVNLYFLHIHCWLPILERSDILYILYSHKSIDTYDLRDRGHWACLLSIVVLILSTNISNAEENSKCISLLELAESEIFQASHEFEIGHIQAALLLTVLNIRLDRLDGAWLRVGQVSRMILIYNERHPNKSSRLPHVIRGCRILDGMISALTERPLSTILDIVTDVGLGENSIDEWEEWTCLSQVSGSQHFGHNTRVPLRSLSILNLVFQLFRQIPRCTSSQLDRDAFQSAVEDLDNWQAKLPAYCVPTTVECTTPSVLNLQLSLQFFMATVVKYANSCDAIISLAKCAASRTIEILKVYINVCDFRSPLLHVYTRQSISCLTTLKGSNDDSELEQLLYQLRIILATIHSRWSASGATESSTDEAQFTDSVCESHQVAAHGFQPYKRTTRHAHDSGNIPFQASTPGDFEAPVTTTASESLTQSHNSNQVFVLSQNDLHDFMLTDATFETDFDTLLDNLPPSMEEGTPEDFAQNLGFLTNNIDPQFLALIEPDHAFNENSLHD